MEQKINKTPIDQLIYNSKINIFWSGKPTYMKGYDYLQELVDKTSGKFNFILNETPVSHTIKTKYNNAVTVWNLSREDQVNLWKRCNVTLLTSRVEGFSLVAAESMLLKKALVVNTQCEIIREFPMQKEIMYFNPNSISDFISAVETADVIPFNLTEKQILFFDSKRLALETHYFYKKVLNLKRLYTQNKSLVNKSV